MFHETGMNYRERFLWSPSVKTGGQFTSRFSLKYSSNTFIGEVMETRKFRKVSRRYESVEDGWIRSYDDLYDLPFMEGESNGYYGDGGSSRYHTIECTIDDGKFFCRYETHDVGAIVEDFFDTRHMKTGRSAEMRPEDFTEEYVKQWVEDALLSGDFVEYYDVETLWDERDNSIRVDDLYRSLEARAKKQEDIMLQAEWDAVSEILEELGMEM